MEGLVNYSSEDDQDDYPYTKVAVRERERGGAASSGRTASDMSGSIKRSYDHSKSGSCEREVSPYRKGRDVGNERFRVGNSNYNEDKYKIDRTTDKSRDHREKREIRESRNNRDDGRDNDIIHGRDYDNNHKYDYKKHDDHKRYRDPKKDYKRDGNDYYRDDKKHNRNEDRKSVYNTNYKDRFGNVKSRYDRKQYDDRFNDERRGGNEERRKGGSSRGSNFDERRKELSDRRSNNNDDDRKSDRRYNDERRTQRSYNEDRSNAYRPRRSSSPAPSSSSDNKYNERKEDVNTRRERKRHSRSRSRSVDNSNESNLVLNNNAPQKTGPSEQLGEIKRPETGTQVTEKKTLPSARNFEALLSLPLSENAPKHPNVVTVPVNSAAPGSNTTTATVQLPSYYNPNVINPNKYVEQMQKRKLIWGAKKTEDSSSKWGHAQFSQDQDGKVASKFMRLMGIKSATSTVGESSTSPNDNDKKSPSSITPPNSRDVKSREAMFSTMEQQYEVARQVTHTMRGVGLGFGSQSRPY